MHLIFLFHQGIIVLLLLSELNPQKIANIGIVNSKWRDILLPKLIGRNWMDKCRLHVIQMPPNISFYQSINEANNIISQNKIDIIIGESRLDVAQAAAFQTVPFIAFDNKLYVNTRPEYDNMPHFYSLPVSESSYAFATFDIFHYYKVAQVAIIIDHTVDYQHFIKPFFEIKSIFSKVWTIPFYLPSNDVELDKVIDDILMEIRTKTYLDVVVKTSKSNLNRVMSRARYFGMISIPLRWYILGFVCDNFNIDSMKHIFSNFTLINEVCSERNLLENERFMENSLVDQFIQIIRLVKWQFSPTILRRTLRNNNRSLLSFDNEGNRNSYTLIYNTISQLPNKTLSMIGSWQKKIGAPSVFHMKINSQDISNKESLIPKHLRIIALEEHPHLLVDGNNYTGFGVDLISKLAEILKFDYTINVVKSTDGMKAKWDKVLSELIEGKADLSLGPVVQTQDREEKLDFSTSFKQREISLVMKTPGGSPSFFQFLGPFNENIWYCMLSTIVILIAILWLLEHFHDKYFPEPDREQFDLKESSWFIIASTLQGGTENVPFSVPGRILTAFLYFFVLIMVTSYTANLAAFLTIKAYPNPIGSVDDLANLPPNSNIIFGTVKNSSIFEFFYHSEINSYQRIYKKMLENTSWLVHNSTEGYLRAMKGNYVFIWDDSVNQFEITTEKLYNCQLDIVGIPFGKRSFAVGMQQGSSYKEQVNQAMLQLMESGVIENLEYKWWKTKSICPDSSIANTETSSLTEKDLAGVFLILLCGVIIAIFSLLIEILFQRGKPIDAIRRCWNQFFARLPSSAEPPITPATPRNTLDYSKYSTSASSMKSDRQQSPSGYEINEIIPQSAIRFDFQLGNDSQNKSTPI